MKCKLATPSTLTPFQHILDEVLQWIMISFVSKYMGGDVGGN
jgi:hypothetical protein